MGVPLILAALAAPHGGDMPLLEAISGIFGSISMASWIFLMVLCPSSDPNTEPRDTDRLPT